MSGVVDKMLRLVDAVGRLTSSHATCIALRVQNKPQVSGSFKILVGTVRRTVAAVGCIVCMGTAGAQEPPAQTDTT